MRLRFALSLFVLMAIGLPFIPTRSVAAQGSDPAICPQFIQSILNEVGQSCALLDAGDVCYGADEVDALPIAGIHPGDVFPDGAFDAPRDRLPVTEVARVSTSELDLDGETWGFSVIKLDAYTGTDPVTGEPQTAELLYVLPGGVEIEAVNEPQYDENGDLILDDLHPAPMQEIYLRNSFDDPVCAQAIPPLLFVQGEPGQVIDLVINEEPIRLEGSAIIEILDDDSMRVTTIYGLTTLNAESPAPTLVPPGFYAEICLTDAQDLGLDGVDNDQPVGNCDWTAPQAMTQADVDRLVSLELLPTNVLFYEVTIPAVVIPSGVGQPGYSFFFSDATTLLLAREACAEGLIPQEICTFLQLNYTASVCPQIVDPALAGFGQNCLTVDAGLACYGNVSVEGMPIAGMTFSTPFVAPGDMVSNEEVARILTSDFDRNAQTWGLSLVKVDAFVGTNETTGEPLTAELLYTLPGGVELEAAVAPTYDANGNLVLDAGHFAPLQQAFLRLSRQDPLCAAAAPPALVVQSEPGVPIDFMMNGALIRLEGTVLLDLISAGDTGQMLRLAAVEGQATLNPDSPAPLVTMAGYETSICLDPAENLGLDGVENDRPQGDCDWTEPQPLTRAGLDRLQAVSTLPR